MHVRIPILLTIWLLTISAQAQTFDEFFHKSGATQRTVDVYFSPDGGCTGAIVKELNNARSSVLVQAYSFTSAPIAKALVDARKRGLDVKIILDRSQRSEKYSEADFTAHEGIPTWIDAAHPIAHNKVMILDNLTVITGSFNFTKNGEKNAENLLIIHGDKALADKYVANWNLHLKHSDPYEGK